VWLLRTPTHSVEKVVGYAELAASLQLTQPLRFQTPGNEFNILFELASVALDQRNRYFTKTELKK
jgi:hypothetical protein